MEGCDGLVIKFFSKISHTEEVVCLRVLRIKLEGLIEGADRLIITREAQVSQPKIVVGHHAHTYLGV